MSRRFATFVLMGALPLQAMAQDSAPVASGTSFLGELASIVLPLAFIILGLYGVLRLVRRRYGMTGQDAPLSVVQILPLGPRERLVLIRARGGRVLAVGVSAQMVRLVTELDADELQLPSIPDPSASSDAGANAANEGKTMASAPLNPRDLLSRFRK